MFVEFCTGVFSTFNRLPKSGHANSNQQEQKLLIKRFHSLSRKVDGDVDRFYIAVFSDLEQTHCAHVACDSE